MLDSDSDNDNVSDCLENNDAISTCPVTTAMVGINGLASWAESADDYNDTNGLAYDGINFTLDDTDNDTDLNGTNAMSTVINLDYRDNATAPVAVDDNATNPNPATPTNPTTVNVLGNDTDAENDINVTSVALVGADANNEIIVANEGTWSVNNTTGDITFTPVAGFTADPTAVTYTVTDNTGVVSNAASVTVDYPQTPTVSTEDNVTAVSGNEVVIDVLANDSDPQNDTDPTTVKIIDPTGNPVTTLTVPNEGTWDVNATTGAISFTPVTGFTGDPTPITYVVSDTTGNTSSPVTVNIVISLDSDGDGIADDVDLDDDNDGILDTVEEHGIRNLDTDGDGVPDRLDLDSDNDGMLDLLESGQDVATVDTNNDGVLDSTTDADQDGVMDSADADDSDATSAGTVTPIDTDGDSKPDFQDVDSDNDSIADAIEAGVPSDKVDATTGMIATPVVDANGIPTITPSVTTPVDTDGDTVPNYRDLDSDNDGLNDIEEADGLDENKDGIVDVEDLVDAVTLPDMDGNNIPDVLEPNNPNLPVVVDTNGDGVIDDATDTDNDGIPDVTDGQVDNFGTGTAIDSDGDGIADIYDIDDDNDGIPDVVEAKGNPTRDTDGDGIIDSLDLDADNDGILDIVEAGGVDANNDGRVDNATDGDKDGLADVADAASTTANHPTNENEGRLATLLLVPDTDKDSKDDFQDVDSDNDGLSDLVEARTDASNDEDNNGMIDGGVDANGIPTATTPIANPLDSDSDGKPDYRELDSDNDGIKDIVEAGGEDTDNNGLVDAADMLVDVSNLPDSNSNGIPNYREIPEVVTPTPVEPETSTPTPVVEEVLVEDRVVSDLAQPVTVNVLENDRANVNSTTVEIGLPEGFMEAHPDAILSDDGKSLTVPNEGTWTVNSDGTITYRAELGTDIVDPTPISYSVETTDGTRLETDTKIILSQSVIGGATETNSTEVCEDYEENVSIYSNGTILLVILLGSLFGVFLFRQER